jgi:hypothetical protein
MREWTRLSPQGTYVIVINLMRVLWKIAHMTRTLKLESQKQQEEDRNPDGPDHHTAKAGGNKNVMVMTMTSIQSRAFMYNPLALYKLMSMHS